MTKMENNIQIQVYLDDGRVYYYNVSGADKAREHCSAICDSGYRRVDGNLLEQYPPHRILKVTASGPGLTTNHPDSHRGT